MKSGGGWRGEEGRTQVSDAEPRRACRDVGWGETGGVGRTSTIPQQPLLPLGFPSAIQTQGPGAIPADQVGSSIARLTGRF